MQAPPYSTHLIKHFNLQMVDRPGASNAVADTLSRVAEKVLKLPSSTEYEGVECNGVIIHHSITHKQNCYINFYLSSSSVMKNN